MEREKYLKKTHLYFVLSMMLVVFLTGCGRKEKIKINSSYDEWLDAIGIYEYPHVYCNGYHEYKNGLRLYLGDFNSETADEYKKIVENHNAFVERNPDYFPEDFDIDIIFEKYFGSTALRFSNRMDKDTDKDWTDYIKLSEMETEKNHCMKYAYVSSFTGFLWTEFEAETIIIEYDKYGMAETDMSRYFTGYKRIIVNNYFDDDDETNVMNCLEKIWQETPEAEVYYQHYPDKWIKYVPEEKSN